MNREEDLSSVEEWNTGKVQAVNGQACKGTAAGNALSVVDHISFFNIEYFIYECNE